MSFHAQVASPSVPLVCALKSYSVERVGEPIAKAELLPKFVLAGVMLGDINAGLVGAAKGALAEVITSASVRSGSGRIKNWVILFDENSDIINSQIY